MNVLVMKRMVKHLNHIKNGKTHTPTCNANHVGSAERMEEEATDIFLRSVGKRNLIYNVFVGDGDTSSFTIMKEACYAKFGECYVVMVERVGHIPKRMGSGLREYKMKIRSIKLSDGKGVGGRGHRSFQRHVSAPGAIFQWAILIRNNAESFQGAHSLCSKDE